MKSRNDLNQFRSSSWLTSSFQVLRDGQWGEKDAVILVPGDIISVKLGDIIPADARLLEGDPLKIDQVEAISNVVDFGISERSYWHAVWQKSIVMCEYLLKYGTHNLLSYYFSFNSLMNEM